MREYPSPLRYFICKLWSEGPQKYFFFFYRATSPAMRKFIMKLCVTAVGLSHLSLSAINGYHSWHTYPINKVTLFNEYTTYIYTSRASILIIMTYSYNTNFVILHCAIVARIFLPCFLPLGRNATLSRSHVQVITNIYDIVCISTNSTDRLDCYISLL